MACGPCDFVAGALAVLARGSDPPEPPDGLRPLRLRRGGLGRAGPGERPPGTPRWRAAPATSSRGPWPCWPGGATPRNPPMACGPCDFVAGALAVLARGATARQRGGRSLATAVIN